MALDGVVVANIVFELNSALSGGRVDKIYQPEADEIVISVRSLGKNCKLLLSANPSHPRLHLLKDTKSNPSQAPMFCMVLRKHLSGGKIVSFSQPNFERIVVINFESFNEMGDLCSKKLIIEIMGKHSNIILTDVDDRVIDSIIRVSHDKSSVREILPGKIYVFPPSQDKLNPLLLSFDSFSNSVSKTAGFKIQKAIWNSYTGISPVMASEICFRASVDVDLHIEEISSHQLALVFNSFRGLMTDVASDKFNPEIIIDSNDNFFDFSAVCMTMFFSDEKQNFNSISETLEYFYSRRDLTLRLRQKTYDLRRIIMSNIERCVKKRDIQTKTYNDIKDFNKWKIYGELITANIYMLSSGTTQFTTTNYYDENGTDITIPLDSELTPVMNAQRYFSKYNKAKRTYVALDTQVKQNNLELEYLETMMHSVDAAVDEADISEIKDELIEQGYIKKRKNKKESAKKKSKPLHFISSDGIDIFVGKNNTQNDELTLRLSVGSDIWLHTKNIPGSHVIIKTNNKTANLSVPEPTLFEAVNLAAFYSKAKNSSSVPVDYTLKKNVKKPNGAKPGMVIYDYYNTAYVTPDEKLIKSLTTVK